LIAGFFIANFNDNIRIMKLPNPAIFVLTAASLASLLIIVFKYDPFVVGWFVKALFFLSLALFLSGIGAAVYRKLLPKS